MSSQPAFRAQRGILVRSVLLHDLPVPPLPDLSQHAAAASSSWQKWVLRVWNIRQIATAVRHASPDLAREVGDLAEQPGDAFDWCDGQPHEIVTCLASAAPRRPAPPLPGTPIAERGQAQMPGASPYVSARLYCQGPTRHALLVDHLPELVAELPRSIWWLTRQDEDEVPHTVLTVRFGEAAQAAGAMGTLEAWADRLIGSGVVSDAAFTAYRPHTGLWGTHATLTAAEEVLVADSAVVAHQHAHQHHLPPMPVLAAANVVAITASFHRDPAARLHWLSAQRKPPAAEWLPKELREQARALAVPDSGWSALQATPYGKELVDGPWADRHTALGKHRAALDATPRANADAVLRALISAHLHLAGEPVDGTAWRLARAAALASTRPRRRPAS